MSTITIHKPDTQAIETENLSCIERAKSLTIFDKLSHEFGQQQLRLVVGFERKVVELFSDPKQSAFLAHKSICISEKKLLAPLSEARSIITHKIATYEAEERMKAEIKALRLTELARKQEEERQLADAIQAEEVGDKASADAILEQPVTSPIVTVEPEIAEVQGVISQTRWHAEVEDKLLLVRFVSQNPAWLHLIEVNMPEANKAARAMKEALARTVPGLRSVSEEVKLVRT